MYMSQKLAPPPPGLYGRVHPKGDTVFTLQVYGRVGISQVEVSHGRAGESVENISNTHTLCLEGILKGTICQ